MFPGAMDLSEYKQANVRYPCIVQPKMDGCRVRIARAMAPPDFKRARLYIMSQNNIVRYEWGLFASIFLDYLPPGVMVEGEFWSPSLSWQQLVGIFKTEKDPVLP
jgi:hypothetical protein